MAARINYVVTDGVTEWHCDSTFGPPPQSALAPGWQSYRRRNKRAATRPGPNYDGTYTSILAARRYETVRPTVRWRLLVHYIDHANVWIPGRDLTDLFGTEALRRSRELHETYGWPIVKRPVGRGATWEYLMDLSGLQRVIVVRRASRSRAF